MGVPSEMSSDPTRPVPKSGSSQRTRVSSPRPSCATLSGQFCRLAPAPCLIPSPDPARPWRRRRQWDTRASASRPIHCSSASPSRRFRDWRPCQPCPSCPWLVCPLAVRPLDLSVRVSCGIRENEWVGPRPSRSTSLGVRRSQSHSVWLSSCPVHRVGSVGTESWRRYRGRPPERREAPLCRPAVVPRTQRPPSTDHAHHVRLLRHHASSSS